MRTCSPSHVFTMWDDVSRERTWAIEEWHHGRKRVEAKTSDAAFQLSLPVIHIHLASPPRSFLLVFLGFLNSGSWRILSVNLWLHCLVLASQHSPSEIGDDSSLLDGGPKKSFIKPIHSYLYTDGEIQRRTKTHRNTGQNQSALPPAYTDALIYHFIPKRLYTFKQTEETVIVRMQLSCTVHLLDCCGTKDPLLMRLAVCE